MTAGGAAASGCRGYTESVLPETAFESVRHFTAEEFEKLVASHRGVERLELLNGRIVMNPPSGWPAGEVAASFIQAVGTFVKTHRLGRVFGSDQGFVLPSGDTVSPDLAFVSNERWQTSAPHAEGAFLRVVPDLAVEVLSGSTSSYDRGEKKGIYARNGVREYWIVDPRARTVLQFALSAANYGAPTVLDEAGTISSTVLAGLKLELAELFAR